MKAAELREFLRIRFAPPEWAMFFEVANGTGSNGGRYADAVAMNMFPSRGLALHGFEIKVSRADWLRELKKPEKSADVQKYCDGWWIVSPKDVVLPGELPATWGHLELRGSKLFCVEKAPKLSAEPIDRAFAAALIRRAGEMDNDQRRDLIQRETESLRREFDERADRERSQACRSLESLKREVDAFEQASGIKLSGWGGGERVGEATRELLLGYHTLPRRLEDLQRSLAQVLRKVEEARMEFAPPQQAANGAAVAETNH